MISKDNTGFTLVELAVATAITGILIIVIMGFATNSFAQISVDSARSDLLRESQLSLDVLTQDARLSSNSYQESNILDVNAPGGSQRWTGDSSTLVLATAAQDRDKNIIFADALQYTSEKNNKVYFVNNKTLYRRTLAANVDDNTASTTCPKNKANASCPSDTVLANNVTGFSVKYLGGTGEEVDPDDAKSVEVTLKLSVRKYSRDIKAEYTTRTVFRNE